MNLSVHSHQMQSIFFSLFSQIEIYELSAKRSVDNAIRIGRGLILVGGLNNESLVYGSKTGIIKNAFSELRNMAQIIHTSGQHSNCELIIKIKGFIYYKEQKLDVFSYSDLLEKKNKAKSLCLSNNDDLVEYLKLAKNGISSIQHLYRDREAFEKCIAVTQLILTAKNKHTNRKESERIITIVKFAFSRFGKGSIAYKFKEYLNTCLIQSNLPKERDESQKWQDYENSSPLSKAFSEIFRGVTSAQIIISVITDNAYKYRTLNEKLLRYSNRIKSSVNRIQKYNISDSKVVHISESEDEEEEEDELETYNLMEQIDEMILITENSFKHNTTQKIYTQLLEKVKILIDVIEKKGFISGINDKVNEKYQKLKSIYSFLLSWDQYDCTTLTNSKYQNTPNDTNQVSLLGIEKRNIDKQLISQTKASNLKQQEERIRVNIKCETENEERLNIYEHDTSDYLATDNIQSTINNDARNNCLLNDRIDNLKRHFGILSNQHVNTDKTNLNMSTELDLHPKGDSQICLQSQELAITSNIRSENEILIKQRVELDEEKIKSSKLAEEVYQLRKELFFNTEIISRYKEKDPDKLLAIINTLTKEKKNLGILVEKQQSSIQTLEKSLEVNKADIASSIDYPLMKKKLIELEHELSIRDKSIEKLNMDNESLLTKIIGKENDIKMLESNSNSNLKEILQLKDNLNDYKEKLSIAELEINSLRERMEEIISSKGLEDESKDQAILQLNRISDEKQEIEEDLSKKIKENMDLKKEIDMLQDDLCLLRNETRAYSERETLISKLKAEVEDLRTLSETNRNRDEKALQIAYEEAKQLKTTVKDLKKDLIEMSMTNATMSRSIDVLEQSLDKQRYTFESDLSTFNLELKKMRGENKTLRQSLEKANQSTSKLNNEVSLKATKIERLRSENDQLRSQIEELGKRVDDYVFHRNRQIREESAGELFNIEKDPKKKV